MPNKRRKSHRLQPTTRCEASSKNPHPSGSTRPATLPHPHCRPPNTTEYDESEYAALPVYLDGFGHLPDKDREVLFETSRVWLDNDVSVNGVAEVLICHPNTVRHRLR
jgi:PucR C-terminal helix-turn-helix domain